MSESISPPRRDAKASSLIWLGALALPFVVVLVLPLALFRDQILLFAQIQYYGAESYPVVPATPFPPPPKDVELETFELDGLRVSVPAGSVESLAMDEDLEGRPSIHLRDGMIVTVDRPRRPITPQFTASPALEADHGVGVYVASPTDFSWGATVEETRRLSEALALKKSWFAIETATEVSQTKRQAWSGDIVRSPGLSCLNWLSADESSVGLIFVHRPAHVTADEDELSDVVFGSFEMTHPPRGTFDAEARRLVEAFEARPIDD